MVFYASYFYISSLLVKKDCGGIFKSCSSYRLLSVQRTVFEYFRDIFILSFSFWTFGYISKESDWQWIVDRLPLSPFLHFSCPVPHFHSSWDFHKLPLEFWDNRLKRQKDSGSLGLNWIGERAQRAPWLTPIWIWIGNPIVHCLHQYIICNLPFLYTLSIYVQKYIMILNPLELLLRWWNSHNYKTKPLLSEWEIESPFSDLSHCTANVIVCI